MAEATGIEPVRELPRLVSNELGLPVPNASVNSSGADHASASYLYTIGSTVKPISQGRRVALLPQKRIRLRAASAKFGGSGANRTRGPESGLPGSGRVGKPSTIASWRRGQESNLQSRFRDLTAFEAAGPVHVPTPPISTAS